MDQRFEKKIRSKYFFSRVSAIWINVLQKKRNKYFLSRLNAIWINVLQK